MFRRKRDVEEGGVDRALYPGVAHYPAEQSAYAEQPAYPEGYAEPYVDGYPAEQPYQPDPAGYDGQPGYDSDPDGGYVAYAEVAPLLTELESLRAERRSLIELCLYARDRANSAAAADRIDSGLAAVGITTLRPDGEPFDPGQHEAAASVPTDDPTRHGRVAETEVLGYADRGVVVRPPVVSVYRREAT